MNTFDMRYPLPGVRVRVEANSEHTFAVVAEQYNAPWNRWDRMLRSTYPKPPKGTSKGKRRTAKLHAIQEMIQAVRAMSILGA